MVLEEERRAGRGGLEGEGARMSLTAAGGAGGPETGTVVARTPHEWGDALRERFPALRVSGGSDFRGAVRWRHIDAASIYLVSTTPLRVRRALPPGSGGDSPQVVLLLPLEGGIAIGQEARTTQLDEGDLGIVETGRTFEMSSRGHQRTLLLTVPQSLFDMPTDLLRWVTAVRLSGVDGIGAVLSSSLRYLANDIDILSGPIGLRLVRSIREMLSALLRAELLRRVGRPGEGPRDDMRAFFTYIDAHLRDPALNTARIARAHYLSVRYVQHLFQHEGLTVSGYIRDRRLDRCRADLRDPQQAFRTVREIAQEWGFLDATHFSRVFRARFGAAPRDVRCPRRAA